MKRGILILSLIVLFASLSSFIVSAYTFPINDLKETGKNLIQVGKDMTIPFFEFLLGATESADYFFQRVLLLILLYSIVYLVMRRMELFRRNRAVLIIVSSIVAVLGARYMSELNIIEAAMLPYGVLGISMTVFLPFLIYFFFVYDSVPGTTGRRLAWMLFALIFFALWMSRASKIGETGWVYAAGIILAGVCILFDPTIKRYFGLHELRRTTAHLNDAQRVRMLNEYHRALEVYNRTGDRAARREMERLARQLDITAGENVGGLGI